MADLSNGVAEKDLKHTNVSAHPEHSQITSETQNDRLSMDQLPLEVIITILFCFIFFIFIKKLNLMNAGNHCVH